MAVQSCKLYLQGEGGTGRTCLLIRQCNNTYPTEYVPTVFDNYSANHLIDGKALNVGYWDYAAREDSERLRPLSYPQTDAFILCFPCIRRKVKRWVEGGTVVEEDILERIYTYWYKEVHEHCPDAEIYLMATKSDLKTAENEKECYAPAEIEAVRAKCNARFARESSALTGEGVSEFFTEVLRDLLASGHWGGRPARKNKSNRCQTM